MKITYAQLDHPLPHTVLDALLERLPVDISEHVREFQTPMHRSLSALGYALVTHLLNGYGIQEEALRFGKWGRPYAADFRGDFNLSRSGWTVACASVLEGRIGIDVEYIKWIDLEAFETQFTVNEWQMIMQDTDPIRRFYEAWTRKEAILKLDGRGLHLPLLQIPLGTIPLRLNGRAIYHSNINIAAGYAFAVACDRPFGLPEIENVSVDKLTSQKHHF